MDTSRRGTHVTLRPSTMAARPPSPPRRNHRQRPAESLDPLLHPVPPQSFPSSPHSAPACATSPRAARLSPCVTSPQSSSSTRCWDERPPVRLAVLNRPPPFLPYHRPWIHTNSNSPFGTLNVPGNALLAHAHGSPPPPTFQADPIEIFPTQHRGFTHHRHAPSYIAPSCLTAKPRWIKSR